MNPREDVPPGPPRVTPPGGPPTPPPPTPPPTPPPPPPQGRPPIWSYPTQPLPRVPSQPGRPHPPPPPGRPLPPPPPGRPHPPPPGRPHPPPPPRPHAPHWPHPARGSKPAPAKPRPRPAGGWRRLLLTVTFGLVNLGPSPAEQQQAEFEAAIAAIPRGNYKVGVLGKGGVGKTTVAACIGSVLAQFRRTDRVVAVDADTAFGRLGSRIDPHAAGSFTELAAGPTAESFADVSTRVGANAVGLYVLAGEPAAGRHRVVDPALYREATQRLDRYFSISIIDCGSTMDAPVTREALRDLDALIVVSSPWADGAAAAGRTMAWLAHHGHAGLLQRTVVVLNDSDGHSDRRTRATLVEQFVRRGQTVVEVPFDPHLRPGGVIDVAGELAAPTRLALMKVAAVVAHYFAARPQHPPPRGPGRPLIAGA